MRAAPAGTMLTPAICRSYEAGVPRLSGIAGVSTTRSAAAADGGAGAAVAVRDRRGRVPAASRNAARKCLVRRRWWSGAARAKNWKRVARQLDGQLTATIHGTPADLEEYASLVSILEHKAGRLIVNGFPTGVEVCPSMQHGGPYPATTDSRSTSVGTAAINRFARPVAYQNFPPSLLPPELQDANPRGIWRLSMAS